MDVEIYVVGIGGNPEYDQETRLLSAWLDKASANAEVDRLFSLRKELVSAMNIAGHAIAPTAWLEAYSERAGYPGFSNEDYYEVFTTTLKGKT
jgi:hypothetical protein